MYWSDLVVCHHQPKLWDCLSSHHTHKEVAGKECLSCLAARAWGVVVLENSCHKQAFFSSCEGSHGHLPHLASENVHASARPLQKSCWLNSPAFCGTVTSLGARGSVTLGPCWGREERLSEGQDRDKDILQYYTLYIYYTISITIYMCVNACLRSGDSSESRVWGWKGHSNVCCLADFQLNLHQLVKPWDCGNLVHFLDNGSYLSS